MWRHDQNERIWTLSASHVDNFYPIYPAWTRTRNSKLLRKHVGISGIITTARFIYMRRRKGDDLEGVLMYVVFHVFFPSDGQLHRSRAVGEILTTTKDHGIQNSSWTRIVHSTVTMWTLPQVRHGSYGIRHYLCTDWRMNDDLENYCQWERTVKNNGVEEYTTTDKGTYTILAFKSHQSTSLTSGMLLSGFKGTLWTYLRVSVELSLARRTLSYRNTWSPPLKYLSLLICHGNVPVIHFCRYLSAFHLQVSFVAHLHAFVQMAPWLPYQGSFRGPPR